MIVPTWVRRGSNLSCTDIRSASGLTKFARRVAIVSRHSSFGCKGERVDGEERFVELRPGFTYVRLDISPPIPLNPIIYHRKQRESPRVEFLQFMNLILGEGLGEFWETLSRARACWEGESGRERWREGDDLYVSCFNFGCGGGKLESSIVEWDVIVRR